MTDIFNTNNLYWVYTAYAKNRLADFTTDTNLKLYKIKIGNYDWFTDEDHKLGEGGYSEAAFKQYFQGTDTNDMGNFITYKDDDGDPVPRSFSITRKELSEDEKSVALTATIDEKVGGFDIREVGIYEEVDGLDRLFAICTMQPLPKPSTETNHYISTQITCRLFSQQLVDVFDYIEIDVTNNYATIDDVNKYQMNLLFLESNLAEQISRNTQIIGYNRVQQLYELIKNNQRDFAKFGMASAYSNIATAMDVKNFWPFRNSGYLTREAMIDDLSLNNEKLGTDQLAALYKNDYEGVASWLDFSTAHYYMLSPTKDVYMSTEQNGVKNWYVKNNHTDLTFIDLTTDHNGKVTGHTDSPFSIVFVGAQNANNEDCTILAKYNTVTEHPALLVTITKNREVSVSLYTSKENFINFKSPSGVVPKAGEFYVLTIEYNGDAENPKVTMNINGDNMTTRFTNSTYSYAGMPIEGVMLPMFSFIRTADGDIHHVNSKVCLLSIIKGNFTEAYKQSLVYNLMALIGKNPCLI